MKKTISLFVLLFSSVLFAQGILDYFPVSKGSVWEYVSDNGTVVETDLMYDSREADNGFCCYLFLEQRPLGITSMLCLLEQFLYWWNGGCYPKMDSDRL